jgi:hypothetical protein
VLNICVGSTDRDLTTTSALKGILGTTATSDDSKLSLAIRAASRWAATYIGVDDLSVQSYQETAAGYSTRTLQLSRSPIRAVPRVFDSTDTGSASQLLTSEYRVENAAAGMLSRDQGFEWNPLMMGHQFGFAPPLSLTPMSGQEIRSWLVDYVAGWTYGGVDTGSANWSTEAGTTSTGRTLPEDVEQAVIYKAIAIYQGGEDEIEKEKLGDFEVNYRSLGVDESGRLLTRPVLLLEPYRRMV